MENKARKRFSVSIICIIAGIILILIAYAFGASSDWDRYLELEKLETVSYSSEEVSNLKIYSNVGEVTVIPSQDGKFSVEAKSVAKKYYTCELNGDTLSINYKLTGWKKWVPQVQFGSDDWGISSNSSEIIVYIPEGASLTDLTIERGRGETNVSSLTAKNVDMNLGVGDVHISNCVFGDLYVDCGVGKNVFKNVTADFAKINCGTGDCEFIQCTVGPIEIDCGIGNVDFTGEILGDAHIDCGTGDVDIEIRGNVDDYSFEIDGGVGDVEVNDGSPYKNTTAKYVMTIDCGVGDVDVEISPSRR